MKKEKMKNKRPAQTKRKARGKGTRKIPSRQEKKILPGKVFSTGAILHIILILLLFLVFFSIFSIRNDPLPDDLTGSFRLEKILEDTNIDEEELDFLLSLRCEELKEMVGTNREVCLYLTDDEGNLIELAENLYGVGCPGIKVNGRRICG